MSGAGPTRLITLSGDLDLATSRGMSAALSEAVGDITQDLVIDMREVTFIDSTALGVLARAGRQLRTQGRGLKLVVSPGPVQELLASTRLDTAFDVGT